MKTTTVILHNKGVRLVALCWMLLTACDDYLDITPVGQVIPTTTAEYRNLITNAYNASHTSRGLASFRTDEIIISKNHDEFGLYRDIWIWNDNNPDLATISFEWQKYYSNIFVANSIIERGRDMTGGKTEEKDQLIGEAYMLRALNHFNLVNLYAVPYSKESAANDKGIPLKLDTEIDALLSRNSVQEVYTSILSDIGEARKRLNVVEWEKGRNYRFNTLSVDAFLSRVYLYMGNWKESLAASQRLLAEKNDLLDLSAGSNGISPNHYTSVESIVALERIFTASYKSIARVSSVLLDKYVTGDRRKANFYTAVTSSVYELKKGGDANYRCSFRTGEIYLNAAEAALHNTDSNIDTARGYLLDLLSKRFSANLYESKKTEIENMNSETLLQEIYTQRFLELAFEGHRWYDLRRTTQQSLSKSLDGIEYTLEKRDVRYTIPIPREANISNPNLAN